MKYVIFLLSLTTLCLARHYDEESDIHSPAAANLMVGPFNLEIREGIAPATIWIGHYLGENGQIRRHAFEIPPLHQFMMGQEFPQLFILSLSKG